MLAGNIHDATYIESAKELRDGNVKVFAVGIGTDIQENVLKNIASVPFNDHIVKNYNLNNLTPLAHSVIEKLQISKVGNNGIIPMKYQPPITPFPLLPPPLPPPLPPRYVDCGLNTGNRLPLDIVFLIDGSALVDEQSFRTSIEIIKIVYKQFAISVDKTHIAVAVYGEITKIIFNLDEIYDVNNMDTVLTNLPLVGGVPNVGNALTTVLDAIFMPKSRPRVEKRLIFLMCGKTVDDIVVPAKKLHEHDVMVIAAGTCSSVSKAELCVIGSLPTCVNAVMMKIVEPPSAPACEFVVRILLGMLDIV